MRIQWIRIQCGLNPGAVWTGFNFSHNINALVIIHCILPVTSCTAKRSFSELKHIKTAVRSIMSNERLSNLTRLHLQLDIPTDIEEIIDEFSRRHPRRIQLSDF